MKIKIVIIIIIAVVLILAFLIIGVVFGFPWEHYISIKNAKIYVEEKYQLTPIKGRYSRFLFDPTMVYVEIYTKELDFSFEVYTDRIKRNYNGAKDNYSLNLAQYLLAKDLDAYIKEITNDQGMAFVAFGGRILNELTVSDIEENPKIVFEKLQESYYCSITFYDDISKKNYEIDYKSVYDIYDKVVEIGLKPNYIYFSYDTEKGKKGKELFSVRIDKKYFPDINSPDDLKPFFEEAIMKLNEK